MTTKQRTKRAYDNPSFCEKNRLLRECVARGFQLEKLARAPFPRSGERKKIHSYHARLVVSRLFSLCRFFEREARATRIGFREKGRRAPLNGPITRYRECRDFFNAICIHGRSLSLSLSSAIAGSRHAGGRASDPRRRDKISPLRKTARGNEPKRNAARKPRATETGMRERQRDKRKRWHRHGMARLQFMNVNGVHE